MLKTNRPHGRRLHPHVFPIAFAPTDSEDWCLHIFASNCLRPVPLPRYQRVVEVVASLCETYFMVTDAGSLFDIGSNHYGLLGQGKTYKELQLSDIPMLVPMPGAVDKVVTGYNHVLARLCGQQPCQWLGWGAGGAGQLGLPVAEDACTSPRAIDMLDGVVDVWCGDGCNFAAMSDASAKEPVLCGWGLNHHGQLGVDSQSNRVVEPTPVAGFESWATAKGLRVIRVTCSSAHTVCLLGDDDGHRSKVVGWGDNGSRQISSDSVDRKGPSLIYDSATTSPLANGASCVVVDAFAGFACTVLMTCQRGLLVRGYNKGGCLGADCTDHPLTQLMPVIGLPARGLEGVIISSEGLIGIDREGRLSASPGRRARSLTGDGGTKGAVGVASIDPCKLPSRQPVGLPTRQLWRLPDEIKAFIGCWVVARKQYDGKEGSLEVLGCLPRVLVGLIVGWLRAEPVCMRLNADHAQRFL